MTTEERRQRHIQLHKGLDELTQSWAQETGKRPSTGTVLELMMWSYTQTEEPIK